MRDQRRWTLLGDLIALVVVVGALLLPDRLTRTDLGSFAAVPESVCFIARFPLWAWRGVREIQERRARDVPRSYPSAGAEVGLRQDEGASVLTSPLFLAWRAAWVRL